MASTFHCPSCQQVVSLSEQAAESEANSPRCGASLTVPQAGSAAEGIQEGSRFGARPAPSAEQYAGKPLRDARGYADDRYEDEDAGYDFRRPVPSPGWRTVSTGLGLYRGGMIGMLLVALGLVLFVAVFSAMAAGQRPAGAPGMAGGGAALGLLALVGVVALIGCGLLILIGQCMCCATPSDSQARGFVIGSVVCLIGTVVVYLLALFLLGFGVVGFGGMGGAFGPAQALNQMAPALFLLLLAALLGLANHVLFILFLRGVNTYFGSHGTARSAGRYLVMYFIFVGAYLFVAVLNGVPRNPAVVGLNVVLSIAVVVAAIVLLLWLLRLLGNTRANIDGATRS